MGAQMKDAPNAFRAFLVTTTKEVVTSSFQVNWKESDGSCSASSLLANLSFLCKYHTITVRISKLLLTTTC
jgi:hypothetical protein